MEGEADLRSSGQEVRLRLLGGWLLTVSGDGQVPAGAEIELPVWPGRLIAFVALHGRCSRTFVAASLWPDGSDRAATERLRALLWRLRHRHGALPPLLEISTASIALARNVTVDVDEFVAYANQLIRNTEEPDDAAVATVLAAAELLPGWYDDWTLMDRERLRQLRLGALEVLANRRLAQARHHEALQAALAVTATEPLHESAHRAVARIYIDDGNLFDAVSHFEMFEGMLRRELDLRPSGKFVEMMQPYLHPTSAGPHQDR